MIPAAAVQVKGSPHTKHPNCCPAWQAHELLLSLTTLPAIASSPQCCIRQLRCVGYVSICAAGVHYERHCDSGRALPLLWKTTAVLLDMYMELTAAGKVNHCHATGQATGSKRKAAVPINQSCTLSIHQQILAALTAAFL